MLKEIIWEDRKRTLFGLPLSFTRYELSNEVLYINRGLFSITEDEIRLYRIMDITLKRSLFQRIFGCDTIKLCTADKSLGDFTIGPIKNSRDIKNMLSEQIEQQREFKRVTSREYMSPIDQDDLI